MKVGSLQLDLTQNAEHFVSQVPQWFLSSVVDASHPGESSQSANPSLHWKPHTPLMHVAAPWSPVGHS
jgi:hypothetical protein